MAEGRTFEQMQELAQQLHPTAVARLNSQRRWEIVLPSEFEEAPTLDRSLDGTPAAAAFADYSSGESELTRWAEANGYGGEALGLVALRYNLEQQHHADSAVARDAALVAHGLAPEAATNWEAMELADFERYDKIVEAAWVELAPTFAAEKAAFDRFAAGCSSDF